MEHGTGVGRESEVRHPRQDLLETDVELQACQIGAEAPMDACAESEVAIRLAIEDAAIRVGELRGVAVCGGVVDDDRFAGAEGVPAQLDILCDRSGDAVNRSGEADELLNGSRQDLGFAMSRSRSSGCVAR